MLQMGGAHRALCAYVALGIGAAGCTTAIDVTVLESRPSVLPQPADGRMPGAPGASTFRTAAPSACIYQLHCMTGVSRFYGVNLVDGMVPSDDPARSVEALKIGEVDLAVVPATSSLVLDPDVHVLL